MICGLSKVGKFFAERVGKLFADFDLRFTKIIYASPISKQNKWLPDTIEKERRGDLINAVACFHFKD